MTNILSDAAIQELIAEAKAMPDGLCPLSKKLIERNQHQQRTFEITGAEGGSFVLYTRQNLINSLDFSAILGYKMPGFNTVFRLCRYNGKSHTHTNTIEAESFHDFHIHTATERYQRRGGFKEDHFAAIDRRYWSLESAISCLLDDCGFQRPYKQFDLFTGPVQ